MAKRRVKKTRNVNVELHIIGHWLFLIGMLMAVVLGVVMPNTAYIASVLVLMGIVVGLLNIRAREVHEFLLATVALVVVAQSLRYVPVAGAALLNVLEYFVLLVAPAALVVAVLAVWHLAKG